MKRWCESMMMVESPGHSEPFSSTDPAICMYVSREKIMFKGLLFVTRNSDDSHTYNSILEVLQLYRNTWVGSIFKTLLLGIDFVVFFEQSNCLYRLPHCISTLEIITRQSTRNLNKLQVHISQKLGAHRASKLLTPLLSMVFTL